MNAFEFQPSFLYYYCIFVTVDCPPGAIYIPNFPGCPPSCAQPHGDPNCPVDTMPACICPRPTLFQDGECVEECGGCNLDNGAHIKVKTSYMDCACISYYSYTAFMMSSGLLLGKSMLIKGSILNSYSPSQYCLVMFLCLVHMSVCAQFVRALD